MRVTVLMGGWGSERAVSLVSGRGIAEALDRLGHQVSTLDMGAAPDAGRRLSERLLETAPAVVFNALHGTPGEDGTVQGLLDLLGLAYTHSGLTASALAIDKQLTKTILAPHGVPVPEGRLVSSESLFAGDPLPRPYVLKPANEGSSVGVAIVAEDSNWGQPILRSADGPWRRYHELLAETYVPGRELTVSVLETGFGAEALGVTELVPESGFYDYDAKYTDGLTTHICPAELPEAVAAAMQAHAVTAHRVLGCRGVSRSDFRWDEARGADGLFFIEINTQPGMTPLSLVPEQAAARGISYDTLVQTILDRAVEAAP
ncbi:MAG: D-alanine--D-alanine ligase [Thermaurantiacus sp.]